MRMCHSCSAKIEQKFIGRQDECPKCASELHCCLNCRFYDETMSRSCREPLAEPPSEKARANFCDYFDFLEGERSSADSESEKAKAAFDALFNKK